MPNKKYLMYLRMRNHKPSNGILCTTAIKTFKVTSQFSIPRLIMDLYFHTWDNSLISL